MRFLGYLVILFLLLGWEIEMCILLIISRQQARLRSEDIFLNGARRILRIARCYWRVRFDIASPLTNDIPSNFVLIANHQNYFDILILRSMFPHHYLRFVAKQSLRRGFPAVSVLMRIQQHGFVSRKLAEVWGDMRELEHLAGRARTQPRICPVLFPEGTRSHDGHIGQFHYAGIWQLALKPQLPIVAVAIHNSYLLGKKIDRHQMKPLPLIRANIVGKMNPPYNPRAARQISQTIRQWIVTYQRERERERERERGGGGGG